MCGGWTSGTFSLDRTLARSVPEWRWWWGSACGMVSPALDRCQNISAGNDWQVRGLSKERTGTRERRSCGMLLYPADSQREIGKVWLTLGWTFWHLSVVLLYLASFFCRISVTRKWNSWSFFFLPFLTISCDVLPYLSRGQPAEGSAIATINGRSPFAVGKLRAECKETTFKLYWLLT